jgi:RimJ/RimL family protein N-acetyltransferase
MADKKPITSTPPSLVGTKFYLRPATAEDIANTHHWRVIQEPQLFSVYPEPILTAGDAVEVFKKEGRSAKAQDFVIVSLKENYPVGLISFSDLNSLNRSARISILIDPDHSGKEHGVEAVEILSRYLFRYRGLNKVYAYVSELDLEMSRTLPKVGFQKDGTLRQHHYFRGGYHNVLIYSLLRFDLGE